MVNILMEELLNWIQPLKETELIQVGKVDKVEGKVVLEEGVHMVAEIIGKDLFL